MLLQVFANMLEKGVCHKEQTENFYMFWIHVNTQLVCGWVGWGRFHSNFKGLVFFYEDLDNDEGPNWNKPLLVYCNLLWSISSPLQQKMEEEWTNKIV